MTKNEIRAVSIMSGLAFAWLMFYPVIISHSMPRNKNITENTGEMKEPKIPCICTNPTTTPVDFVRGDVNNDGKVSIADITALGNHIRQMEAMDFNSDRVIDEKDVDAMIEHLYGIYNSALDRHNNFGR